MMVILMIEKTKVKITLSENFDDIMILMNDSFYEKIKENEHFFEEIGQKLDLEFRKDSGGVK